ncbi:MAG: VWA domain-containing protein [Deltaproteobacteria bacterium]
MGSRTDPNAVAFNAALANRFVPAATQSAVVARLRIGAATVSGASRPPVNLGLVVDTSGSMEGQPIDDARTAALAAIDALSDGDVVSVVVFHSSASVLVPATRLDRSTRAAARARVLTMRALGTTDMAGGMALGLQEVQRRFRADGVNRIVLLSDGVPNNPANIELMASQAGARGIAITSLGLGLDFNESIMASIARVSGGRFHFLEQSSQVAAVFRDEVLRSRRVLGRNAMLTLTPGPDVRIEGVVGLGMTPDGNNSMRVSLGDVTETEARDLIVRLAVGPRRNGASVELMDAVLSFDDAIGGAGRLERRLFLGARATSDDHELSSGRDTDVERTAARIEAAAATVDAVRMARLGNVGEATQNLLDAERRAREIGTSQNDRALIEQAESINALRNALPSVAASAPSLAVVAPRAAPPAAILRREHDRAVQFSNGY